MDLQWYWDSAPSITATNDDYEPLDFNDDRDNRLSQQDKLSRRQMVEKMINEREIRPNRPSVFTLMIRVM